MAKQAKKAKKERKPTKIEIWARENPSRAVMIALVVLCVLRIGIFLTESGGTAETTTPDLQPWTLPTPIAFSKQLLGLIKPRVEFDKSEYKELASGNIFDPKQVLDSRSAAAEAEALYSQADARYKVYLETKKKEDLLAAKQLVGDALLKLPSHFKARNLRKDIDKELGLQSAEEKAKQIAEQANKPTTGTTTAAVPSPAASPAARP